jgi:hypothetical protein
VWRAIGVAVVMVGGLATGCGDERGCGPDRDELGSARVVLDAATGDLEDRRDLGPPDPDASDETDEGARFEALAGAEGVVIGEAGDVTTVLGDDGQLRGIHRDPTSLAHTFQWNARIDLGLTALDALLVGDQVVAVGAAYSADTGFTGPLVYAVDAVQGAERWRLEVGVFQLDAGTGAQIVEAKGVVIVATDDDAGTTFGSARAFAVDAETGRALWRSELPHPRVDELEVQGGEVRLTVSDRVLLCD